MMFLVQMWSLNMNKTRLLSLVPDLVTDDLIKECCDLFNLNFDKAMNGKVIKIFPSRMKKYINSNSLIFCLYTNNFLIGYMITEKMTSDLIWIKQIVIAKEFRNNGLATQLVRCIINYKYIGIITNNPIMIKILKIQGFSISQDKKKYQNIFDSYEFRGIVDLYKIDNIVKQETNFVTLTYLVNLQKVVGNIFLYPLANIEDGYEWIVLFCDASIP